LKGAIDPPQSPFIQRVSWQPTCVGLKQFYSKHLNVAKGKVGYVKACSIVPCLVLKTFCY